MSLLPFPYIHSANVVHASAICNCLQGQSIRMLLQEMAQSSAGRSTQTSCGRKPHSFGTRRWQSTEPGIKGTQQKLSQTVTNAQKTAKDAVSKTSASLYAGLPASVSPRTQREPNRSKGSPKGQACEACGRSGRDQPSSQLDRRQMPSIASAFHNFNWLRPSNGCRKTSKDVSSEITSCQVSCPFWWAIIMQTCTFTIITSLCALVMIRASDNEYEAF